MQAQKQKTLQLEIDYAARIREIRLSRNLSQFSAEIECNLPVGTISRIENKRVNPSKETLLKVVAGFTLNCAEACYLFGLDALE